MSVALPAYLHWISQGDTNDDPGDPWPCLTVTKTYIGLPPWSYMTFPNYHLLAWVRTNDVSDVGYNDALLLFGVSETSAVKHG